MPKVTNLILLFLMLLTGYLQSADAQNLPVEDEVNIRETLLLQSASWNKGDLKGFMEAYWKNDSLVFISSGGVKKGWQAVYDSYAKSFPNKEAMGNLGFEFFQIRALSSTDALVVGKWTVKRPSKDDPKKEETKSGHFTLRLQKIQDAWVIISDHTN